MEIEEFMRRQEFIVSTLSYFGADSKPIDAKTKNEDFLLDNLLDVFMAELKKDKMHKNIMDNIIGNQPESSEIKDTPKDIEEYIMAQRRLRSKHHDRDRPPRKDRAEHKSGE